MPKKTYLTALVQGKCPHCRTGNMFAYPASNLSHFSIMNDVCPHCGIRLEPEPGYYQGAMFVSYAFSVIFIIIVGSILYFVFDNPSDWTYIIACTTVILIMVPLNYRYSRIWFLYLFGGPRYRYDPSLTK